MHINWGVGPPPLKGVAIVPQIRGIPAVLRGDDLTPHHPSVLYAIDVIIGRSRVFIFSMSRAFIFGPCCVQILVCVMFSL